MTDLYPTITKADSSRGAPMGRSNWKGEPEGQVTLYKLPLDAGGYDPGGAYWGSPDNLYYAVDEGGEFRYFTRAKNVQEARHTLWDNAYQGPLREDKLLVMLGGYLTAALWAEAIETEDKESEYYDMSFHDANFGIWSIAEESVTEAINTCHEFLEEAKRILPEDFDADQLGHCFWMSQQGHGTGFPDYPEKWGGYENAQKLRDLAHKYPEKYPWLTADEKVML